MVGKKLNRVNVVYNSVYEVPLKLYCFELNISITEFFQAEILRFVNVKPVFEKHKEKVIYKRTTIMLEENLKKQLDFFCLERNIALFDVFNFIVRSVVIDEENNDKR